MEVPNPFGAHPASRESSPFAKIPDEAAGATPPSVFGAPSQTSKFAGFGTAAVKPAVTANPFAAAVSSHGFGAAPSTAPKAAGLRRAATPVNGNSAASTVFGSVSNMNSNGNGGHSEGRTASFSQRALGKGALAGKKGRTAQGEEETAPATSKPPMKSVSRQPNGTGEDSLKRPRDTIKKNSDRIERAQRKHHKPATQGMDLGREPTEATRSKSQFAYDYAKRLYDHLAKENIKPPTWPSDVGTPAAAEPLKEAYKTYRERVYTSLRKSDLIDDPDKRRRLEDALPFKGICEDMCPEYEKVRRIAEHDAVYQEKVKEGTELVAEPSLMVKKFGRSAAGQDAPLPMDVRSIDALRRTTDYLFDDLLQCDDNLPIMHNFLWDRTRAVRRDFTFHSAKTDEEMKDVVYIYETIARFHTISHHLLSRKGFGNDDFDQKQETEQLGRTLLSLMEAYDACRDRDVTCENEPEFRAYWLLLNAHDTTITSRIPSWGEAYWFDSEEVQTAFTLVNCMLDAREQWGPIKPRKPRTLTSTCFQNYFEIVKSPEVSYTMACVAEIHFTHVREGLLRNLVRTYSRARDGPRYITAAVANEMLNFDSEQEARDFMEEHDLEFTEWVPEGKSRQQTEPYVLLNDRKKMVPSPRVRNAFSGKIVERKRQGRPLPHVLRHKVFEDLQAQPEAAGVVLDSSDDENSLFVCQDNTIRPVVSDKLDASSVGSSSPDKPKMHQASSFLGSPGHYPTQLPGGSILKSNSSVFGQNPTKFQVHGLSQPSAALNQGQAEDLRTKNPMLTSSSHISGSVFGTTAQASPSAPPFAHLAKELKATPSSILPATSSRPTGVQGNNTGSGSTFFASSPFSSTTGKTAQETPKSSFAIPATAAVMGGHNTLPNVQKSGEPLKSTSAFSGLSTTPAQTISSTITAATASKLPQPTSIFTPDSTAQVMAASRFLPTDSPAPNPQAASNSAVFGCPPSSSQLASQTGPMAAMDSQAAPGPIPSPPAPTSTCASPAPTNASGHPTSLGSQASFSITPAPAPPQRDLMGDFTKWFALGDGGLLQEFQEAAVEEIVRGVFVQHQRDEAERKLREVEERLEEEGRQWRRQNLQVKFFYRWRDNARRLRTKVILQQGKVKMRAYHEAERAAEQRRKAEEEQARIKAEADARRRAQADGYQFTDLARAARERRVSAEMSLLASGVFDGLRDERGAARRAVHEADGLQAYSSPAKESSRPRASTTVRAPPSVAHSGTSETVRRDGWKTRSLRERYVEAPRLQRSFSGGSSSVATDARGSSPSTPAKRATNFSRKRSADVATDNGRQPSRQLHGAKRQAQKTSGFQTQHWEMRARGFVPMPDGSWLPESIARPMLEQGKRFAGIGNCGLGPGEEAAAAALDGELEAGDLVLFKKQGSAKLASTRMHENSDNPPGDQRASAFLENVYASPLASGRKPSPKRKRGHVEAEDDDDGLDAALLGHRSSFVAAAKKANTGSGSAALASGSRPRDETEDSFEKTQRHLREIRANLDRLDRDEPWMQEQLRLMESGRFVWDGS